MNNLELHYLNLLESLRTEARRPGVSSFREASTAFTCGESRIRFQNLILLAGESELDASGSVDFSHTLDFRVRIFSGPPSLQATRASSTADRVITLTGPLFAPRIARATAPAARP
jgi:hypothetical protein